MPLRLSAAKAEDARRAEFERAVRLLARGAPPAEVIDLLSQRLTNKLLHAPLLALNGGRAAANEGERRRARS